MRTSFFAGAALLALAASAAAQPGVFNGTDWFERPVAEGVVWRYYQFENLFNSRQSISWLEVDLSNPLVAVEFPYLATGLQRTSAMIPAQQPAAVAGVNGNYFNTTSGGSVCFVRIDNEVVQFQYGGYGNTAWQDNGAIGVLPDGSVEVFSRPAPSNDWSTNVTHPDILSCGPMLQENGARITPPTTGHCPTRNPRTAVGVTTDNRLILVTIDGRTAEAAGVTCAELTLVMEGLGCVDSLNMDGGGSTTMWVKSESAFFSGVVNYPSDNGQYDRLGERSAANAIAVIAPTLATPPDLDARIASITYSPNMLTGSTQTVTVRYTNIGTSTWSSGTTTLGVSRSATRQSAFRATGWASDTQPAVMTPASVGPGQTATFTFTLQAPEVTQATAYREHFALYDSVEGRFGPADNELRLTLTVSPPVGAEVVVESRLPTGALTPGPSYTEPAGALADTSSKSVISSGPVLVGVGARYTATIGRKGRFQPELPAAGLYNVYVTLGSGSNNNANADWVLTAPDVQRTGSVNLTVSDSTLVNRWKLLASEVPLPAGSATAIEFTNLDGNAASGKRFVMDSVRFERTADLPTTITGWVAE